MITISSVEENYLKVIYKLSEQKNTLVPTNAIAVILKTSAASVTDMIQKLHQKGFLSYQKYQGVTLTKIGKKYAIKVLRKHLLWEVFLLKKLHFGWNEVHEVAEQLEHIQSPLLIQRLDDFLGNPSYGPHGDVIPNEKGNFIIKPEAITLTEMQSGSYCIVHAIKEDTTLFLEYLNKRNIDLGTKVYVIEKIDFDHSMDVSINHQQNVNISKKVSDNILVITA